MGWFGDFWDDMTHFRFGGAIKDIGHGVSNLDDKVGDFWDSFTGASAQKKANKTNIQLQKNQQDWEERMSSSEVSRRVADLQNAGLNPMLSIMGMGSASTPNVAPARVESTREKPLSPVASALAARLQLAQLKNMAAERQRTVAETNLNDASAEKVRAETPNVASVQQANIASLQSSAAQSNAMVNEVASRIAKLEQEVKLTLAQTKGQEITNETAAKLKPLLVEQKRLENKATAAGIPEKEVRSQVAKMVGSGVSLYEKMPSTKIGEGIGRGVADFVDWISNEYRQSHKRKK